MTDLAHDRRLPGYLRLTARRSGDAVEGIWFGLVLPTRHKNPHRLRIGPSDQNGQIVVDRAWLIAQIKQNLLDFPMDYSGVGALSGDIRVQPMPAENAERLTTVAQEADSYADLLGLDREQLQSLDRYALLLRRNLDLLREINVAIDASPDWAGRLTVEFPLRARD